MNSGSYRIGDPKFEFRVFRNDKIRKRLSESCRGLSPLSRDFSESLLVN